jgi:pimeloyl-ACP methyl ester carboxylesterase/DNA-binding CsgD family transcriptional regulator
VRQTVRFVATPHGRVAYSVIGSGPPLVLALGWVSHLGLMWETPSHRRFVERLARDHTVIRYDKPGCGLSDRSREEFTLDSELDVLKALIGHLGLRRMSLLGCCDGGQVAAAYAGANPDAVASLVVYGSCARGRDLAPAAVRDSVLSMVRAHWGLGSRVLADIWFPDAPLETAARFARVQRAAATAEMAANLLEMFYRTDIDDLLPEIRVPTLVLHRRGGRAVPFELGRQLAARIPGAQLSALEGRMQPIDAENDEAAATAVVSFTRPGDLASVEKPLTDRELQVVGLIEEGWTNAAIARTLGVSVRTVDAHLEHVRAKLGLRTRAQIAVWASRRRRYSPRPDALPVGGRGEE